MTVEQERVVQECYAKLASVGLTNLVIVQQIGGGTKNPK